MKNKTEISDVNGGIAKQSEALENPKYERSYKYWPTVFVKLNILNISL